MRFAIVSCVFPPEPVVSSQTSASIGRALSARGDEVEVVTAFPSRPAGRIYPGYRRSLNHSEVIEGMNVRRLPAATSERSTGVSRGWENLSFGLLSAIVILVMRRPAVMYINSWPIVASGLAAVAARIRGIPYVISVQDLYPESLVTQSRTGTTGILFRVLRQIDASIARNAAAVMVITPRFLPAYEARGVHRERLHVVRNWGADVREVDPHELAAMRANIGAARDDFVFTYGGNIGVAAGVHTIIEAYQLLDDERAVLCIAGAGSELAACRHIAERMGRITFRTPWPAEETETLLGAADVLLLPTLGKQSAASVPSKLIGYMLAGRPVLAAVTEGSETAQVISSAGCGWCVPPSDPGALAVTMRAVMLLPREELASLGSAGQRYAKANFTAARCVPAVLDILSVAAGAASER